MSLIKLPDWVNWIAKDKNGAIWGFEAEPHLHDYGWYENEIDHYILLTQTDSGTNWQNSLVNIKYINSSPLKSELEKSIEY